MSEAEFIPPQPTGHKAVVHMKIDVLIEVQETDDYHDMVSQAQEMLRKRVLDSSVFLPFRSVPEIIHDKTTVAQLEHKLTIDPRRAW